MESRLIFPDESYAIKGAAMDVYRFMGNGFLEAVYQECLAKEFTARDIPFVLQPLLALTYRGQALKATYKPDFICYGKIIVELKAVANITNEHRAQVLNYLKGTGYRLGFLFNFGHYPKLEQVRIINGYSLAETLLQPSEEPSLTNPTAS